MKKQFATSILLSMLITLLFWPGALSAQSKNVVAGTVGKVSVNKNSSIEIIEPYLVQWGKNNVLSFKVRLFNGGGAPLDLLRYGITVKTNAGNPGMPFRLKNLRQIQRYCRNPAETSLSTQQFLIRRSLPACNLM